MANLKTSNPMVFDTTGATSAITTPIFIRLIQWIDDAADIADDDVLSINVNGATLLHKVQLAANDVGNTCIWQAGPFNPGVPCSYFYLTTMGHGLLHVWIE